MATKKTTPRKRARDLKVGDTIDLDGTNCCIEAIEQLTDDRLRIVHRCDNPWRRVVTLDGQAWCKLVASAKKKPTKKKPAKKRATKKRATKKRATKKKR